MKIKATIKEGKLVCDARLWQSYLASFRGVVTILIEPWTKLRSNPQNRLYWAYLRIIANDTGNDDNELHDFFKSKFLPPVNIEIKGVKYTTIGTTTKLNSQEFTNYLDKICSLTNIPIPNIENI